MEVSCVVDSTSARIEIAAATVNPSKESRAVKLEVVVAEEAEK